MSPNKTVLRMPRQLARASGIISGLVMLGLLGLTAVNVIGRQWSGKSVPGTIEYTEVLLAVVVFLGLAHADYDDAHVRTSLLTSKLGRKAAQAVRCVGLVASILFLSLMVWAMLEKAIDAAGSGEFRMGVAQVPIWPVRIVAVVGVFLLLLAYVDRLVSLRSLFKEVPVAAAATVETKA